LLRRQIVKPLSAKKEDRLAQENAGDDRPLQIQTLSRLLWEVLNSYRTQEQSSRILIRLRTQGYELLSN
jgi:hypothetical protein